MKTTKGRVTLQILSFLLFFLSVTMCGRPHMPERPYLNPLATLQDSDLVGVWEVRYFGGGVDRLTIRADGTFKQVYRDAIRKDYVWETPWNEWWLEHFSDGRARLHLRGARYYLAGIDFAERGGLLPVPKDQPNVWRTLDDLPFNFVDPVSRELVQMVQKLVLNVRRDSSGRLILMHMWTSGDREFPVFGGEWEEFRRVDTP